jgi:hypothetical protein
MRRGTGVCSILTAKPDKAKRDEKIQLAKDCRYVVHTGFWEVLSASL